jgi:hypothetical protein
MHFNDMAAASPDPQAQAAWQRLVDAVNKAVSAGVAKRDPEFVAMAAKTQLRIETDEG